jgi:polyisoprenoid-binding protein YceI
VEGTMAGLKGDIKFSKNKLGKSSFKATASPETIQTGIKLRDKHLKKADYFDVGKYPTIQITSKEITKSKEGFESRSTITLKGLTKDLIIPFTFSQTNDKAEFKGSFSLNRLDFGLGEKSLILSETVEIEIWVGGSLAKN